MGGKSSKYTVANARNAKECMDALHDRFYDQIIVSDMKEDFLRLEEKLEYGMRYDEWINTYFQGNSQKAMKLLLAAVAMAEDFEEEIMQCVREGPLELHLKYSLSFYILIAYVMRYTSFIGGEFVDRFRVRLIEDDLVYRSINATYRARAIIAMFPDDSIVEPSKGLLLTLVQSQQRDNLLGYRLPYQMVQAKEKQYFLKAPIV